MIPGGTGGLSLDLLGSSAPGASGTELVEVLMGDFAKSKLRGGQLGGPSGAAATDGPKYGSDEWARLTGGPSAIMLRRFMSALTGNKDGDEAGLGDAFDLAGKDKRWSARP